MLNLNYIDQNIDVFAFNDLKREFNKLEGKLSLDDILNSDSISLFVDIKRKRVWIWHGSNTTTKMKFIAAKLASTVRDRYDSDFKIAAVDEGNETLDFKIMIGVEDESEYPEAQFRSIYDRTNGYVEWLESLSEKIKELLEEGDISVLKHKLYCKYCGSKLIKDQDFCNVCGEKVI